ncbi:MAG: AAA family ATPase [Okeania sp. SIO2F4]|uniref:AAA family ATPase n=1 Tax=Okeania sp. SIO2F4 TaxID=2607790 RepID=UPI0014294D6D|nr:AAA family ATPase [Okeania sp. SIO2F4]NES03778.1 AAA family ATPase [Okeania sp. SIO2F4]
MVNLAGYQDFIQIHKSANSLVYRARRVSDTATATLGETQPVIIKFLNQDYPTSEQIRRYKQEYYLTCQLESPGIIKAYSLEEWQRSYAIVLEDFGGISLKRWLKEHQVLSTLEFLLLAIQITEIIGKIHAQNVIHKDINPDNIVFNPKTKELKIIDFGIATELSRENPTLKNPNVLEGTLAYISPEQTGRMNRGLDYRSDFYSLGVTFYEMLTGKLPFESSDPLELVHSHIAKPPPSIISKAQEEQKKVSSVLPDIMMKLKAQNAKSLPSTISKVIVSKAKIPSVVVDIVMKLMAKNAEDRYQSAYGLKADLEECRRQLEGTGNINSFPLGQQDISDRFQIPQKLYGREKEIATLLAAFKRVVKTGKVELMLVSGYSGIGKSSLVQELFKPITECRGYFISGKFDQFQRNIPYSAIVAAFRGLIGQLLGESRTRLQVWREKLLQALGNNGQIIIDVIPEVELIIGKQPPVTILGANESQNRFNLVFSDLISSLCDNEHPLTLFIDDLQWADLATLTLIERLLVAEKTQDIFLLGAYRDNEVSASHPLAISLKKLKQNKAVINKIKLKKLPIYQIAYLIGDTLKHNPEKVCDLAWLVMEKTGGNPFFINEFLQALYSEELLKFNHKSRIWQWNIEAIKARRFTDNVVELMVYKLQRLPKSSQEVLSLAACLGAEFDLKTIAWVGKKSAQETFQLLKISLDRNLILPRSELDENLLIQSFKFSHDRIQQAAYALIPDDKKNQIHYQIGQVLLQKMSPETKEEQIFELVNQLNYGTALISQQTERDELAQLNLLACRKARDANAYQASRQYANIGLALLGENSWSRQYEMTLEFYELAAELAFLCGDFEVMEQLIEIVIANTRSLAQQVNVYRIRVQAYNTQNQLTQAIATAQQFLQQLGITFPQQPTPDYIKQAVSEIYLLLGDGEIESLVDLPIMEDQEKIAIVEIANSIMPTTYIAGSPLFPLLVSLSVKLSIEYGNTEASAYAYSCYGIIACNILQDVDVSVKFGQLALKVVSKLDLKAVKPLVIHIVMFFLLHYKSHIKETIYPLQEGYGIGLEVGSLEFAGYNAHAFCLQSFWSSQPLAYLEKAAHTYFDGLVQLNQLVAANWCRSCWLSTLNLLGISKYPTILSDSVESEGEFRGTMMSGNDSLGLALFYLYKMMLCYMFEEIEELKNYVGKIKGYVFGSPGLVSQPIFYFYDSLIALATLSEGKNEMSEVMERVEENQRELQKQWANSAPMNYQHKVDLVEAEKCRVLGKKGEAIELYDLAISGAKENKYIQEEALANELAAKFYLDWQQEKIASIYMMEAHYCYSQWGAIAKVKHLEEKYPQLSKTSNDKTSYMTWDQGTSSSTDSDFLDLATVIKSTTAISSEIVLEKLLATLMDILIENAGAQRGILILPREEGLFIEATKEEYSDTVSVLQSIPLSELKMVASKIVYYVARTRQTIVLNNATREGNFTDDPYIQKYKCQSIACTPLINQGKLQGIIYLENNLTTGAFTKERMALLRTIASQAAISLENAQLYNNITKLNQAYERFVPAQFLSFLDKKSIVDVKLGDQVERKMTVLFSDIRDFTTISEQMTPAENFAFINEYLGYMEPQIQAHGGFIDKYIGDAIMALFPNSADDALQGAIAMLQELKKYNLSRQENNLEPLRIGIGLHTGLLMLGTVGGFGRMDGTAIGDAVNLSSRVEGLTKTYGVSLLITEKTFIHLNNPLEYDFRFIAQVKAKGKAKAVSLFEVFSAESKEVRDVKIRTKGKFEKAVLLFHQELFEQAGVLFQECLDDYPGDRVAQIYLEWCHEYMG